MARLLEVVEEFLGRGLVNAVPRRANTADRPALVDGSVVTLGGVSAYRGHVDEVRDTGSRERRQHSSGATDSELLEVRRIV